MGATPTPIIPSVTPFILLTPLANQQGVQVWGTPKIQASPHRIGTGCTWHPSGCRCGSIPHRILSHENNHGHKYPSEDPLVTVLGMRVCREYIRWDTSVCILRRYSNDSPKVGNRQRQAYAHNNVAIKGCCQVGCVIERFTEPPNPICLRVRTTCRTQLETSINSLCR